MKKIIFAITGFVMLTFAACYDEKMEWVDPYNHPVAKDLPLELQEKISRYAALNTYTEMTLGVGIDFNLYMNDEKYRNLVNENFDEVTPGNEMKHSSVVSGTGELVFRQSTKDAITALKAAGLTIYGHTLVWHSQQNSSYLNSLIAPQIIPQAGATMLSVAKLLDKSFDGWNRNNAGGITIVDDGGLNGEPAVKFEVTAAGSEWNTQLTSPEIPVVAGHAFEISFWVKSENDGQARMSFSGMNNNYPYYGSNTLFSTSGTWTKIVYNQVWDEATSQNVPFRPISSPIKIAFDFGKIPGTYYVDINSIAVVDLDAEVNLVQNGDFETGDLTNWTAKNAGAGIEVSPDAKYAGTYGIKATASATSANEWDLQFAIDEITLDASKTYTVSFMIKSDIAGEGRISYSGFANNYPWTNWDGSGASARFTTNSSWKQISYTLPNDWSGDPKVVLNFDLGKVANVVYYVDDVKIVPTESGGNGEPVIIEKTDAEKEQIIDAEMHRWIKGMVEHYDVAAWDVVNEALSDAGTGLKTGKGQTLESGYFYWQDYYQMPKNYAVQAFKYARQYAKPATKLFINDYNLETSPSKLQGLVDYVQYIESQGATVDGIGTQMHLDVAIYTDTAKIDAMFQMLAATGKLVKISELDVKVGDAPTAAQLEEQAKLYEFAVRSYIRNVPENQRYGITVWGVSDNEKEHEYWLKGDQPNLWNADYARKHAYKGFADGLAGRDVSEEFEGTLQ
ncbi:hypothetical protein FACS189429_0400 [Bacteroidia bacterium]|nr:hypothetical protein FACS189429_0400 [Bacteroidia bacterium]